METFKRKTKKTGMSDHVRSRNSIIKKEYEKLRNLGYKKEAACEKLSDIYFLSISRINSIIYSKE